MGEQPLDLLPLAAAEHLWRALLGRGFVVELGFQLQIEGHPSPLAEDLLHDRRLLDAPFGQEAPGVFLAELAHQVLLAGLAPALVVALLPAQPIAPADHPEHLGQLAHQIHQPALPWLPPPSASAHPGVPEGFVGVEGDQGRRAVVGDGVIPALIQLPGEGLAKIPGPLQRQLGQQLLF